MELNTISLPQFTRLANVIFAKALDMVEKNARGSGLFVEEAIPANSGDIRDYTEIDLELYADNKPQGNQAGRAKVILGYNKTVSVKRVAKDIGITYEMRRFNKYPDVVRRLTNLAQIPANRLELDLSHRLGFGTATTYTDKNGTLVDISVGDTLALFSTVHTLTGTSATYRNRLAGNPILSKGALEGIERLVIEETLNNFGEKITAPFDILWTTDDPNSVNTALEYLKSVAAPDFANSGVTNVYKGKYKHVILPLVATTAAGAVDTTKRRYWGIASSMISDAHLGVWEAPHRQTPSDLNAGEEFSTDDWNYGVRGVYCIEIVSGVAFKLSKGTGEA